MVEFERVYIDSSVIARLIFRQPGALQVEWGLAVSSELLAAELFRGIDRLRISGLTEFEVARFRIDAQNSLAGIELMPLDSRVLRRVAGQFPAPLGTLDAIHLATALMWYEHTGKQFVLLTHDRQLADASEACGLQVYPRRV